VVAGSTDYEPQSLLITGGAGFIGSHVVLRLAERYPHYKVRPEKGAESAQADERGRSASWTAWSTAPT